MADLLSRPEAPRARLRQLLAGGAPVLAPGAYDALSARLVEQAGFDVVYMTGFGTTASLLGRPDVGLLGQAEMVGNARRIASGLAVPLIADADTGYGNAINVIRTVREYEQAGVAGLHLEDQVLPKRCGHLAGKEVIPAEEMVGKIRAAVDARTDPDLVLIARTDVAASGGVGAAIERAKRYRDAGADLLFVEALPDEADVRAVAAELGGNRLVYNWAEGGRSPTLTREALGELGFALVLFPITTLLAATTAVRTSLERLRSDGDPRGVLDSLEGQGGPAGLDELAGIVGLAEIRELEQRYR